MIKKQTKISLRNISAGFVTGIMIPVIPATSTPKICLPIADEQRVEILGQYDYKQIDCLAHNIYFEARGESLQGQLAVANVTINRVQSGQFPNSICGVVKQGGYEAQYQCQFTWYCDGSSDIVYEKEVYNNIKKISLDFYLKFLYNERIDNTDGSLFYHTKNVNPRWSQQMEAVAVVDQHIFYKPYE